jgi:Ni,Fe-hydrogenase I cytochrome b subunit
MEEKNLKEIYVWDLAARVLHWANALLIIFLASLAIGFAWMEGAGVAKETRRAVKEFHAYTGHVFLATFFLRILWGFLGNKYIRWSDTFPLNAESLKNAWGNLRWMLGGLKGTPPLAPGHNPLASLLYLPLFIVLLSQAATGVVLSGEEFKTLPGRLLVGSELTRSAYAHELQEHEEKSALHEAFKEAHGLGLWFILFFIFAHLLGLVIHELGERRYLFSSMIHGRKIYKSDEPLE